MTTAALNITTAHWSEIIPRQIQLPPGTPVRHEYLGPGTAIDMKPAVRGWPFDGYIRWFVFGEDRQWKKSSTEDIYLDLDSPEGFVFGVREFYAWADSLFYESSRHKDQKALDWMEAYLENDITDEDRTELALALYAVFSTEEYN